MLQTFKCKSIRIAKVGPLQVVIGQVQKSVVQIQLFVVITWLHIVFF